MSDLKGFVFTGMVFLMVIPAMILAASFLNMMETGDKATALVTQSDAAFAVYNNVDSSLELASCSYFLINDDDTATILLNLTGYWAPYIEGNYTTISVSIAENEINVTYNITGDYIKVGNINNIDEGIPITITVQDITYQRDLGPLKLYKNCSEEIDVTEVAGILGQTLYLANISEQNNLTVESPTTTQNQSVVIADGESVEWVISPFDNVSFDTIGPFNVTDNIVFSIYLRPIPDGPADPTASLRLFYDGSQLGSTPTNETETEGWWIDYFTGVTGTIIPENASLTLRISVKLERSKNPTLEVIYNSTEISSAIVIPGNITMPGDTTPPEISNVSNTSIGPTSVIIEWNTSESSDSLVNYSTYPSLASSSTKSNMTSTLSHVVNITGLSPATTYYYEVLSTDPSSNTGKDNNSDLYYNFTTLGTMETLWCDDPTYGCLGGELCDSDGTSITIAEGTNVTMGFDDPTYSVNEIYSAIIYWVDQGTGNRTFAAGDGTDWTWNSTTGEPPDSNDFALQNLNITSYFQTVSMDDASDIENLQVNYTNLEPIGAPIKTDDWDQVYVNVTYY